MTDTDNNIITLPTHCEYDDYEREIEKVRHCVEGSHKIKHENYQYLPHPSMVDTESKRQKARYREFIAGAEFDDQPGDTLQTMLGKMRVQSAEVELPDRVSYLEEDADGDGSSLKAMLEYTASNVLQVKYHIVIADYQGLSDIDLDTVSIADAQRLNPRANLKAYTRENVINWHFDRVNGKMQLAWIALLERGSVFSAKEYCHNYIESYLILGLDEEGNYYQEKKVRGGGKSQDGERTYPTVNGKMLKFIPLEIVSDQERPSGCMPQGS